jgi:tetratricopeptide (TPR) repeat protein
VKVEQALRMLPELEALAPLRALLLSSAQAEQSTWANAGQNLTVGKREVAPAEMRQRMTAALKRITEHLSELFETYVRALESMERESPAEAVANLLAAGALEETVGRLAQARAWFGVALEIAEGLPNRRPEVETLLSLGRLSVFLGYYEEAARRYQRALVLAEAEFDQAGAIDSCMGLGTVDVEQAAWAGGHAWFARGLRLAEASRDERRTAQLHHGVGELARRQGDLTLASRALQQARERFEALGDAREMARVLLTQGLLESDLGLAVRAASAYREALAWTHRTAPDTGLEVFIRLNFARLHLEERNFLEAEQEIRRAEQLAIAGNLTRRLVQIYTLFGRLRGLQGDENGFVFFEQAIHFARTLDLFPVVEAQAYHGYGMFKLLLNQPEESRGYLERARELFELAGSSADLERVKAELKRIMA